MMTYELNEMMANGATLEDMLEACEVTMEELMEG